MGDKYLMENLIYTNKVISDLYMHGAIESSNEKVFDTFKNAFEDMVDMHHEIFTAMEESNFYTTKNVEESKIKELKQKIENCCINCED